MSRRRALEAKLTAWRAFRDVAHATRTLASAQALTWAQETTRARDHLAALAALTERLGMRGDQGAALRDVEAAPRPRVLLAVGSELGLCGPLNRSVLELVMRALDPATTQPPDLVVLVGARLLDEADSLPIGRSHRERATTSVDRLPALVQRVEGVMRALGARPPSLEIVRVGEVRGDGTAHVFHEVTSVEDVGSPASRRTPLHDAPVRLDDDAELRRELEWMNLHARIAHALAAGAWHEASARMIRMTRAHDVAATRIEQDDRRLATLRQDEITMEMLEARSARGGRASRITA